MKCDNFTHFFIILNDSLVKKLEFWKAQKDKLLNEVRNFQGSNREFLT